MAYYLDLFSPETHEAFSRSMRDVSGFRPSQAGVAARVQAGDILVCYVTKVSRWAGLLSVQSGPFTDHSPLFQSPDPFTLRFRVEAVVWLPLELAIPIRDPRAWTQLSFTRGHSGRSSTWTGQLRSSLTRLDEEDGALLEALLRRQRDKPEAFHLTEEDRRRLTRPRVRAEARVSAASVPEDLPPLPETGTTRESLDIQALLAYIGARMKMRVWIPPHDRAAVVARQPDVASALVDRLPLNYDSEILKTVEQIDVLWLKGRAIQRAFEVEHTTSVYSGILRMADLLALQPNMDIHLHLVAPADRRAKVFQEVRRPVFERLERGPLSARCTYLSYDGVQKLASEPLLHRLQDDVLEEYQENIEDPKN